MKYIASAFTLFILIALASCGRQRLSNEEFRETAVQAEQLSLNISMKQAEIRDILQAYNQTVPASRRLQVRMDPDLGLSEDELDQLREHTDCEPDASCQGLLERIFVLQEHIDQTLSIVNDLTASLPPPHVVRRGETHYALSLSYLMTEHKLARHLADSIVSATALSSDIMEGFKIWFMFDDDMFCTLVTQGKAHISPAVFAKVVKKQLLDDARAQGNPVEYESILDSLKRTGALLSSARQAAAIGM